jgi:IS5 family transposase
MRFAGLGLHEPVPHANTIWLYREQLRLARAIEGLFGRSDAVLADQDFLAMSGQIIDATIIAAPRQKLTMEETAAIRDGRRSGDAATSLSAVLRRVLLDRCWKGQCWMA